MPNLYVANPTSQDHIFHWREVGSQRIFHRPIPAGHQIQVLNDVDQQYVWYVIEQYKPYGMVSIDEAKKVRTTSEFKVALVYSLEPMPAEVYELIDEVNEEIVARQTQAEKEKMALSVMKSIEDHPELASDIKGVELEIIESKPKEPHRQDNARVKQKFTSKKD